MASLYESYETGAEMKQSWSNPVRYDLTRSKRRASIPKEFASMVPESSGVYVIYRTGEGNVSEVILDIGETGPRPNSTAHGLRGRLATTVSHSASEKIARDKRNGKILCDLRVIWFETESKSHAKDLQDALITLFRSEYGLQPVYNSRLEVHP
jgi:hypothetical protein